MNGREKNKSMLKMKNKLEENYLNFDLINKILNFFSQRRKFNFNIIF